MKFGLMYEIQIPQPHYQGIEQDRYKQVMAQVALADRVPDSYQFAVSAIQHERAGKTFADHLQSGAFAMGNPDTVIKVLKKHQEAGVDQILCFMQMGNLAHTRIMDSITLFGQHVIPYFK